MAKVDLKELEALEAKQLKHSLATEIQEQVLAGVKVFKGPFLDDWFDDYGECILANADARRQAEYKKAGLDEFGRTKEQVELSQEKAKLLKKKAELLEAVREVELDIQTLRIPKIDVDDDDDEPKKKKRKKK